MRTLTVNSASEFVPTWGKWNKLSYFHISQSLGRMSTACRGTNETGIAGLCKCKQSSSINPKAGFLENQRPRCRLRSILKSQWKGAQNCERDPSYMEKHTPVFLCILTTLDTGHQICVGFFPNQAILRHQIDVLQFNLWHYLCEDSVKFNRLEAQSHKPVPTSDTITSSEVLPVLLINWL